MPGRPPIDRKRIEQLAAQGVDARAIAHRLAVTRGAVYMVLREVRRRATA